VTEDSACLGSFLVTVHMRFSKLLAKLGGEAPLMVMEKSDECLVIGKAKLGGDLLDIFVSIAKKLLCTGNQKTVDQLADAKSVGALANAGDMIGRIAEAVGDLLNGQAGNGMYTCPFVDPLRFFVIATLMKVRQVRKLSE